MPAPSPRLEDFLRLLADRGMLRGVDRRLRIELALRELGEPADRRELHDLLVPLVARNREEQARFRELFDDFFGAGPTTARRSSSGSVIPRSSTQVRTPGWRRPIVGAGAAALVVVALIWLVLWSDSDGGGETVQPETTASASPAPSRGPRSSTTRIPPRTLDTLLDADPGLPAVPIVRDESRVPGRIVGASFGTAAIIGLPMLLVAFASRRRRALAYAADDARKRTPPLVYTPKPPKPPLFMSAEFFDAVRVAVRRQRMDGNRISVERTVAATIAAGGLPTLRYEPASRPPEYLILIERASSGDHQALLFDAMAQRMRQEGMLYVERYFYERDPRLCRSEQRGPTTIDELQRRFHEHRLVVFGDGDGLFDALSEAELAPWTSVFEAWQDRAILTARPVAAWGARERALGELFVMLPGTPQGLREIVESFERGTPPDMRPWREGEVDRRWTRRGQADVQTLRASLDPSVWRWVCACAVYPNLHWALTLYLATLPELGGGELLREEHLLRVVALPWFRDGFMSPEVRAELVDELDDKTERAIRHTLARLLELDAPDADTAAGRWHEAQMFVQAVLANPDDKEVRAALESRVRALPKALLLRDPAAARRLREVHHKRLDRLPRAARTVLYRDGISLFGSRPWTRRSAGAATVLAVAVLPSFLWMRREEPPGKVASFIAPLSIKLPRGRTLDVSAIPLDSARRPLRAEPVTWSVRNPQVASVSPLVSSTGSTSRVVTGSMGTTWFIVTAGGSSARIPITVVPDSGPYAAEITMPAKKTSAGMDARLATEPSWTISCNPGIATEVGSSAFHAWRAGSTRIASGTAPGAAPGVVELRELVVSAAAADTSSLIGAPITFGYSSPTLSPESRATLDRKIARMRTQPSLRLVASMYEPDAFATRMPISSRRWDALVGYFEKNGIPRARITRAETPTEDTERRMRVCDDRLAWVTFAATSDPLLAGTSGASSSTYGPSSGVGSSSYPPRATGRSTTPTPATRTASSRVTPNQAQNRPAQVPPASGSPTPTQQTPTQNPNEPAQVQQAQTQQVGAPNAAQSNAPVSAGNAVSDDTAEAPAGMKARLDLRDERGLKLAPVDRGGINTISRMPAGSYAFASSSQLIEAITKGDTTSLPTHVRRTDRFDFEIHNVRGVKYIAGFVEPQQASRLQRSFFSSATDLDLLPSAAGSATCPIEIPVSSVRTSTLVAAPTPLLKITIQPRTKDEPYVPRGVTGCRPPAAAN